MTCWLKSNGTYVRLMSDERGSYGVVCTKQFQKQTNILVINTPFNNADQVNSYNRGLNTDLALKLPPIYGVCGIAEKPL